jgi:hypothetical protein
VMTAAKAHARSRAAKVNIPISLDPGVWEFHARSQTVIQANIPIQAQVNSMEKVRRTAGQTVWPALGRSAGLGSSNCMSGSLGCQIR